MRIASISTFALVAMSTWLAAQTPQLLIGASTSTAAPLVLASTRQDTTTCATKTCPIALPAPATAWAGGTAYDPTTAGVWHTDGKSLGLFDPNTCAVMCPPISLGGTIAGLATGLAYNESTNTLFMSDATNTIYTWKGGCPPTVTAKCSLATVVPTALTVAGLATSDQQKLIYYSASDFAAAVPGNIIYIAPQSLPCAPICKFAPLTCPGITLGPITGLAYNDCQRTLWATDGVIVVGMAVTPNCAVTFVGCCRVPPPDRYHGLCIMPSQATRLGSSCTKAPCPVCAAMVHVTIGDPAIGNPAFALSLQNAPGGMPAVLAINAGACTAPGVPISIFCANLLVPLPGIIAFGLTIPGALCAGVVNFPLPVPLNPWLCGRTLSSQYLMVCPSTSSIFGTGVSNCLSFTVSSS